MKGGRLPLARPKRMQPNLFASAFWRWWASLNAPAQTSSSTGRLIPGAHGDAIQIEAYAFLGRTVGWSSSMLYWSGGSGLAMER